MSKSVRIVIQLPVELKQRLDDLKQQGYTASGLIRAILERELSQRDLPSSSIIRNVIHRRAEKVGQAT